MPSRTPKEQQHLHYHQNSLHVQPTSRMLYESVDNYHSMGFHDSSIRLNNPRDLNDFSSQSIVCAMDRFVKAVNNMNETIMVPCRLIDMEVRAPKTAKVPKLLKNGGDPYNYYSLLNSVKNDLILGASTNDDDTATTERSPVMLPSINSTRWAEEGEAKEDTKKEETLRRQSTMSLASESSSSNTSEIDSTAESCSESNEDDDRSSEGEESALVANEVTQALHTHLLGLHACLKNLTDTAAYITDCYKESAIL